MAAKSLTLTALRQNVAAVKKAGGNMAEAARQLKISHSTVRHRVEEAVKRGIPDPRATPEPPPRKEPSAEERLEERRLRVEVSSLRRQLAEADAARLRVADFADLADTLRNRPMDPPDWTLRVPSGADSPGIPVLDWSDWHIGETVVGEHLHNANRFDAEVADQRVKQLVDRTLYCAFQHVKTPQFPGCVLILGGDMVSGWLHEELFKTDWCPPPMAANWCVSRLRRAILRLADAFGRVHIVCVPGNHGRLTKKPMAKGHAVISYDHAIYAALAEFLGDDARVTFSIPPEGDCIIQIAGTRYMVTHGHTLGVKGGDGIIGSLGPIMRGAIKVGRAERSLGRDFDVLVLHHFHQSIWQPRAGIIVNGTLKGYDEYAHSLRLAYAPASQWLWFSHPRFGPNLPFDIFLQEPARRDPVPFVALPERAP